MSNFTKAQAAAAREAAEAMWNDLSRPKKQEHVFSLNEIMLFIEAAERVAPAEVSAEQTT